MNIFINILIGLIPVALIALGALIGILGLKIRHKNFCLDPVALVSIGFLTVPVLFYSLNLNYMAIIALLPILVRSKSILKTLRKNHHATGNILLVKSSMDNMYDD